MGQYELEQGFASYRTIVDHFIGDIVLCNINDYDRDFLTNAGFVLSYSDLLECDVLCVDHFGTSWDYILTDIKLFDSYEELEKYGSDKQ